MEYTICNESLVLYAIRNKESSAYFYQGIDADGETSFFTTFSLSKADIYDYRADAEEVLKVLNEDEDLYEIRKVKIIDIGGEGE